MISFSFTLSQFTKIDSPGGLLGHFVKRTDTVGTAGVEGRGWTADGGGLDRGLGGLGHKAEAGALASLLAAHDAAESPVDIGVRGVSGVSGVMADDMDDMEAVK